MRVVRSARPRGSPSRASGPRPRRPAKSIGACGRKAARSADVGRGPGQAAGRRRAALSAPAEPGAAPDRHSSAGCTAPVAVSAAGELGRSAEPRWSAVCGRPCGIPHGASALRMVTGACRSPSGGLPWGRVLRGRSSAPAPRVAGGAGRLVSRRSAEPPATPRRGLGRGRRRGVVGGGGRPGGAALLPCRCSNVGRPAGVRPRRGWVGGWTPPTSLSSAFGPRRALGR